MKNGDGREVHDISSWATKWMVVLATDTDSTRGIGVVGRWQAGLWTG